MKCLTGLREVDVCAGAFPFVSDEVGYHNILVLSWEVAGGIVIKQLYVF